MSGTSQSGKRNDSWLSWALIVFLFLVGAWPIALVVVLLKLFAPDQKSRTGAQIPYSRSGRTQSAEAPRQSAARPAQTAARAVVRTPQTRKSTARILEIAGAVLGIGGLLAASSPAGMVFAGYVQNFLWEMLQALAVAAAGGAMFFAGWSMEQRVRRYPRYLAVIGQRESMSLEELVGKLGFSQRRVVGDLEKMIEQGYFGPTAYLNRERGLFCRSQSADREEKPPVAQEPPQAAPREAEEGFSGILRNIRRANDAIADPELSAKIDHLEEITARIFRAVEEDPKKRGRIDTLLNYYLPTTQKLLDTYAQFEAAGVEGENLRQAKERIRATMDSIIAGFEHQLDSLYQADAMDVDSDIRVMESMLRRDTASAAQDFGASVPPASGTVPGAGASPASGEAQDVDLGGAAAQKEN